MDKEKNQLISANIKLQNKNKELERENAILDARLKRAMRYISSHRVLINYNDELAIQSLDMLINIMEGND